jgi:hypothetical protein
MSNTGEPIVPSGEPSGAPTVQYREPEDYAELKAFRQSFEEKILPHWDTVRPILEDDDERTFYEQARKTRERLRAEAEPELPPEFQTFEKRLESKFGGVVEYVQSVREREAAEAKQREADAEAERQRGFETNKAYAQRIMAERADFRNADGGPSEMMTDLIILAANRKMTLEDAYKEYGPKYFGVKPAAVPREPSERKPPSSLRNGDPGVPGESAAPKATTQKERLARMRANMINAGRGA